MAMFRKTDLARRVDQLSKIVDLQQQTIDAQQQQLEAIGPLVKELRRLGDLHKLGDLHTDQIRTLAAMITHLGVALKATQVLTPEAAVAVRDVVRDNLDPDASDGVTALVRCLDIWVDHHSASGSKFRPTVVVNNDG
jgi:hypothetical protein